MIEIAIPCRPHSSVIAPHANCRLLGTLLVSPPFATFLSTHPHLFFYSRLITCRIPSCIMLFPSNILSIALTVSLYSSSVVGLAMELPRDVAVAAASKKCTADARFPPLSPTVGNMTASQATQYTVIDNALTKFYGGTGAIVKNADGSFAGPFGQLL